MLQQRYSHEAFCLIFMPILCDGEIANCFVKSKISSMLCTSFCPLGIVLHNASQLCLPIEINNAHHYSKLKNSKIKYQSQGASLSCKRMVILRADMAAGQEQAPAWNASPMLRRHSWSLSTMRSQSQDGGQLPVSNTASGSVMHAPGQGSPHAAMQQHTAQVSFRTFEQE